MNMKRCCFAGHSEIYDSSIIECLKEKIVYLIEKENVKEFWVGNYGSFDKYSAVAVRSLKKEHPEIKLVLVIPYITKEIQEYKKMYYKEYDEILISQLHSGTPTKYMIIKTNYYMVDNSEYLICYINNSWGGAVKTFEYAKRKKHIRVINIGKLKDI